jgi:hypothetical protein
LVAVTVTSAGLLVRHAFALMVATDLMMLLVPSLPTFVAIAVTIAALWGAARFTSWYPKRKRAKPDQQ